MNELESISTEGLWRVIEECGRAAQKHLNWLEYLDRVKICSALIDSRIQSFERTARAEKLLKKHREPQTVAGEASEKREVKA